MKIDELPRLNLRCGAVILVALLVVAWFLVVRPVEAG